MARTIRLASVCLLFALGLIIPGITSAGGVGCAGAPPSQLQVGEQAQRPPGPDSNVRAEPSTRADFLGQIPAGGIVDVLDGPTCADGYSWWKIDYQGLVGWTPEGIGSDYWLKPLNAPLAATPTAPLPTPLLMPTPTPIIPALEIDDGYGLTLGSHEPAIIFESESSHFVNTTELFVMNPDGSNVRPLIPSMWGEQPSWSPDGMKVAFISVMGITVLDTDTGKTHAVNNSLGYSRYAWSPDSQKIVFSTQLNRGDDQNYIGDDELFIVNTDGSNLQNLTNAPTSSELYPSWSPDGSQLIFVSNRGDPVYSVFHLFTLNVDSNKVQPLVADVSDVFRPIWSPNAENIALVKGSEISILNWKTGAVWDSGIQSNSDPVWSSDGHQLAFVGRHEGSTTPQLYVVDSDGSHLRTLSDNTVFDISPSWSPDGQELLVQTLDMRIYAVSVDGESAWQFLGTSTGFPATATWRPSVSTHRG
ncbi:MAG: SH3 domain-containing protein [Chloroflexota bacterium]